MKPLDLTGRRFGDLVAVALAGRNKQGRPLWLCRCDCGGEARVTVAELTYGRTRSCGHRRRAAALRAVEVRRDRARQVEA